MGLLTDKEIETELKTLPNWHLDSKEIVRNLEFDDFASAIRFVNLVAAEAEKLGHHPDIDIRWNKVRLALSSHDAGGLTDLDFGLATKIESVR